MSLLGSRKYWNNWREDIAPKKRKTKTYCLMRSLVWRCDWALLLANDKGQTVTVSSEHWKTLQDNVWFLQDFATCHIPRGNKAFLVVSCHVAINWPPRSCGLKTMRPDADKSYTHGRLKTNICLDLAKILPNMHQEKGRQLSQKVRSLENFARRSWTSSFAYNFKILTLK